MLYISQRPKEKHKFLLNTLVHMFIIKTSERAIQNNADVCSNLHLDSPLSLESVPSQSNISVFDSV